MPVFVIYLPNCLLVKDGKSVMFPITWSQHSPLYYQDFFKINEKPLTEDLLVESSLQKYLYNVGIRTYNNDMIIYNI